MINYTAIRINKVLCIAFLLILENVCLVEAQLVGHWPLDEDAINQENGVAGELFNADFVKDAQIGNGALAFGDRSKSRSLWLGDRDLESDSFSLSMWIKPNATTKGHQILMAKRNAWADDQLLWQFLYGAPRTEEQLRNEDYDYFRFESFSSRAEFRYQLPIDRWTHVVLSYSGNSKSASLYINGERHKDSEQPVSLGTVKEAHLVVGGPHPSDWKEIFDGTIDDIALWSEILTPDFVKDLYKAGQSTTIKQDAGEVNRLAKSGLKLKHAKKFTPIYNGKDLSGWYTFLREYGKNQDPKQVFKVTSDSTLFITGEVFGYIGTLKEYENFHLKLKFKWGVQKYAPRKNSKRDSGILYHFPSQLSDEVWPKSIECQIQEGDCGDFWLIKGATIESDAVIEPHPEWNLVRILKQQDGEKERGSWNVVEIISKDGNVKHIINGVLVNQGTKASVTKGRILLQSEGAEIYFKDIQIKEL